MRNVTGTKAMGDNPVILSWPQAIAAKYPEMSEYCAGYTHDNNEGKGQKTITFAPELPASGKYEVWFAYSPNRKSEHPAEHLKNFQGVLQADAYAGFNRIYAEGHVLEAACWAHVRRKMYDLHQAHRSPIAALLDDNFALGLVC